MSKTRHLDRAIEIFKSDKGKRAKPLADFTLSILGDEGILQGARGKTIASVHGTREEIEAAARAKVPPGKTLEVW